MKAKVQSIVPAERVLDEAIEVINKVVLGDALATARRVGEYIMRVFFENDAARVLNKQNTSPAFRALLQDDRLRVSTSYLWFALHVSVSVQNMPDEVAGKLPLSHHRALLRVTPEDRTRVARKALAEDWSRTQLESYIGKKSPGTLRNSSGWEARTALHEVALRLGIPGPVPASTIEVRVLKDLILDRLGKVKLKA